MSIGWFNVLVILFFGFYYFKSESLVKSYSSLITNLDMPAIRKQKTTAYDSSYRTFFEYISQKLSNLLLVLQKYSDAPMNHDIFCQDMNILWLWCCDSSGIKVSTFTDNPSPSPFQSYFIKQRDQEKRKKFHFVSWHLYRNMYHIMKNCIIAAILVIVQEDAQRWCWRQKIN